MEGYELENLEDPSDIIEEGSPAFVNNDVLEISVENSVNNNSEVTNFVEISVDKSVEHGVVPVTNISEETTDTLSVDKSVEQEEVRVNNSEENDATLPEISVDKSVEVPVNNSEENNVTRLKISVPVNNRENNDTLPEISVDKNNDTLPDIEETGEVSTATNTVNNKQLIPKV